MAERVATEKFWVALGYRPTENFVGQLFHHAQTAGAKPPVFYTGGLAAWSGTVI